MSQTNGTAASPDRQKLRDLRLKQQLLEAELRVAHLERLRDQQQHAAARRRESEGWEQLTSFSAVRERLRGPGAYAHLHEAQTELQESGEAWEWLYGYSDVIDRITGPERDLVLPISTALDRRYGWNWPFWRTWLEHARYRASARLICTLSGLATGILKGLASYVIGEGMTMDAGARKKQDPPPELLDAVQAFLDDFYDCNGFALWQREMFMASRRDGEYFTRHFVGPDGMTQLRVILPECIIEPAGYDPQIWSFGLHNEDEDLQKILGLWVAYDGNTANGEEVPEEEFDYLRINVDAPVKRGLSDFCFDTYDLLKSASRMVNNMTEGGAVQAAIAYIVEHEAATANQVNEFLGATADYQALNQRTGNGALQNVQQVYPGMRLDIDSGQKYQVPPFASNASGFVEVIQAGLRSVAVRWNAPEWLASGDASNNNYASSLTAESPFVKTCKAEQACYKQYLLGIVHKALRAYCKAGRLRAGGRVWNWQEVRSQVEIQCEAPTVETRNKLEEAQTHSVYLQAQVESVQTVQQQLGLDPGQERENIEEQQERMGAQQPPLPDDPDAAGDDDQGGGLADLLRGGPSLESLLRECGGEGGKPGPCSTGGGEGVHAKAVGKAQKVLAAAKEHMTAGARKAVAKVQAKVAEHFAKLEERYGRAGAIAVMSGAVALAPLPVPGTFLAPVAIAESVLRLRKLLKGTTEALESEEAEGLDVKAEARKLLAVAFSAANETPVKEGEERRPFDAAELLEAEPKGGQFQKGGGRVAAQAKHDTAKKAHGEAKKAHKAAERTLTRHEAKLGKSAQKVQQAEQAHREARKAHTAAKRAARKKTAGKAEHRAAAKAEKAVLSAKSKLDKAKGGHKELRKAHGEARKAHKKAAASHQRAQAALQKTKAALDALKAPKPARGKPGAGKPKAAKSAPPAKPKPAELADRVKAFMANPGDLADAERLVGEIGSLDHAGVKAVAAAIGLRPAATKRKTVGEVRDWLDRAKVSRVRTDAIGALGRKPAAFDPAHHVRPLVQAVAELGKDRGGLASLADVRDHLAARGVTDRVQQDAVIHQARRENLLVGSAHEGGRHQLSDRERAAQIPQEGESPLAYLSPRQR